MVYKYFTHVDRQIKYIVTLRQEKIKAFALQNTNIMMQSSFQPKQTLLKIEMYTNK